MGVSLSIECSLSNEQANLELEFVLLGGDGLVEEGMSEWSGKSDWKDEGE